MKTSEETVRPFRLVKFFTFSSLIVIFISTIVLSVLNTDWIRTTQQKRSEEYALFVAENLNHQIFWQFFIPAALKYKKIKLRDKVQADMLDKVIRSTLHGYKVDMVSIYDAKKNVISYSFNKTMVGKENVGGLEYLSAIAGKASTKLIQKGNFIETLLGFPSENKMITTTPLHTEDVRPGSKHATIGVLEIVQDLSEDFKLIFRFQLLIISTITIVMCSLFIILIIVVRKGEAIIDKRAEERLKLEEQLRRSEHLSSIGEMVAGISHEIRNPLGIIRSSGELLKKKMAALDPSSSIPDIIVEEAIRLNSIITDFLDFAKPRQPNLTSCRIENILEKNLTSLAPQFEEKGCFVEKQTASFLPEILADSNMLYQAFLNILINGMQSMPRGGKIFVGITSYNDGVNIIFEDEGPGIPDELLKKVWDPFFSTKDKGTGLGLGIVKNIIEAHNGTIQITNRQTQGTRVFVTIPAVQGK
ncbi:MAG: two-component sensor histidine kinase [Desulfobacteraceae bacterium]|nr:MAG: two-component sensor histidine kinase [Desulfobacteraceae bacterium]